MPVHNLVGSGMIEGTVAVTGAGTYDLSGTVTTDGESLVADAGKLKVVLPGKYLLSIEGNNDASPPSGFTYWPLRILVNASPVGNDCNTYVNGNQTYSGAALPVAFPFKKEGSTSYIADLVADDIINGEAEDPGDTNTHSCNIDFTIIAHYLGGS